MLAKRGKAGTRLTCQRFHTPPLDKIVVWRIIKTTNKIMENAMMKRSTFPPPGREGSPPAERFPGSERNGRSLQSISAEWQ